MGNFKRRDGVAWIEMRIEGQQLWEIAAQSVTDDHRATRGHQLPGSIPTPCRLDWHDMGSQSLIHALSVAQANDDGEHRTRHYGRRTGAVRLGASSSTWRPREGCGRISRERDRRLAEGCRRKTRRVSDRAVA